MQVFISHASADKVTADAVCAGLEARGLKCWIAPRDISAGVEFADAIISGINAASAMIVLVSRAAGASPHVAREIERAVAKKVRVLPLRLEEFTPTGSLEYLLSTTQWLDGSRVPKDAEIAALDQALRNPSKAASKGADGAPRASICVLPFANVSGDGEQEYFSDGITEDIITDLSKVSALSVVSRNTSFTYKGKAANVRDLARALGVSHVLEGSVRKSGKRVRISAQLVAADDSQVWAERYDRDLDDIFALQDEISRAIVGALKVKLKPAEKQDIAARGTNNAEAYKLYLMARQFRAAGGTRHFPIIIRLCRRAIEIDPGYARAWALLALAQILSTLYTTHAEDSTEAIRRALELDPGVADAHAARAWILVDAGDVQGSHAEVARALELDPDSYDVQATAGRHFFLQKSWDEALAHLNRAAAIAENDFWSLAIAQGAHAAKGDVTGEKACAAQALARIERALATLPDNGSALAYGASCLIALGECDRAIEWIERALLIDPDDMRMHYNSACAMVRLGEFDRALELLERALVGFGMARLRWAQADPDLDPLRRDPRFDAMLARVEAKLAAKVGHGA